MIQLLGWIGSALIVLSLTLRRQLPFRLVNLISAGVLLVFNLAIGLWSMVLLNTTIMIVNLYQLRRMRRHHRTPRRTGRTGLVQAPPAEGWFSTETQLPRYRVAASDRVGPRTVLSSDSTQPSRSVS
jgi:inner membrane protein